MRSLEVERLLPGAFTATGVFVPTATSRVLANLARNSVEPGNSVLDLGCGSGVVGLQLARDLRCQIRLSMSDVSHAALRVAKTNANLLNVEADLRVGSLFDPWDSMAFDVIVSDVSGVVPRLGSQLGWFNNVSNESGPDGIDLAAQVVCCASRFLASGGKLIMPVLSLSNESTLLGVMSEFFRSRTCLGETALPLPQKTNIDELRDYAPFIRIDTLAGVNVFYTTVWSMSEPGGLS